MYYYSFTKACSSKSEAVGLVAISLQKFEKKILTHNIQENVWKYMYLKILKIH